MLRALHSRNTSFPCYLNQRRWQCLDLNRECRKNKNELNRKGISRSSFPLKSDIVCRESKGRKRERKCMKLMVKFLTGSEDTTSFSVRSLPLSIVESPSRVSLNFSHGIIAISLLLSLCPCVEGSCRVELLCGRNNELYRVSWLFHIVTKHTRRVSNNCITFSCIFSSFQDKPHWWKSQQYKYNVCRVRCS